ncbi:MAG: sensor domain-containing diguanylate cyclase [Alphaproteobacteria bacterium]|nr:MAG: sensor domain-containing diguanylate cyclase [Alphaproteobacteria bacterium]
MHQMKTAPITADQLDQMFRNAFLGITVHRGLEILYVNRRVASLLGYDDVADLMAHSDLGRHIPADNHRRLLERWSHIADGSLPPERNRIRNITQSGQEIWLDVTDEPVLWQDGKTAIMSTITDVSTAVQANESLLSSFRRLEASLDGILETIPTGVAIFSDSGRPRIVNSAMRALFQDDPHPNLEVPPVMTDLMARIVETDAMEATERAVATPMGRVVDLVARRMDDNAIMMCAVDVSDWQARQDQLRDMAEHDPLTGLLNRRGFRAMVKTALKQVSEKGTGAALMMVDIDFFKKINDTHGHAFGDMVLRSVAKRLEKQLRDGDLIARVGGEEFCIFLPNCDAETAELVAERLRAHMAADPFANRKTRVRLTASFGLKTWDGKGAPRLGSLQGEADAALYRAKQMGRNRVVIA